MNYQVHTPLQYHKFLLKQKKNEMFYRVLFPDNGDIFVATNIREFQPVPETQEKRYQWRLLTEK